MAGNAAADDLEETTQFKANIPTQQVNVVKEIVYLLTTGQTINHERKQWELLVFGESSNEVDSGKADINKMLQSEAVKRGTPNK